jgi:hypothetical protein
MAIKIGSITIPEEEKEKARGMTSVIKNTQQPPEPPTNITTFGVPQEYKDIAREMTTINTSSSTTPQQQYLDYLREQQIAALGAAKDRALTGLDTAYGQKQNTLGTAKNTYLTNLENAKNKASSNLDSEYAKIDPYYYDARNQVQSASDIGAKNFAEYMASRGIKGSAAGIPDMYRNSALQGNLGALNRQEAANKAEIERVRSDMMNEYETNRSNVLNNYQSDLAALEAEYLANKQGIENAYSQDIASAQAGINAQGLQAYLDQLNADRAFSLNEAAITGRYGGEPTLAGQKFQQEMNSTAKQSWLDTIGRFGDNYQAEINRVQGDNDTTNDWQIPYLQAARQQKIQQQAEQQAAQMAAASEEEKQQYKNALELWKTYGQATPEIAAILGVPEGARTADYDIDRLNNAVSQQNADTAKQKADQAAAEAERQAQEEQEKEPTDNEKIRAIETSLAGLPPQQAYDELVEYSQEYIADIGITNYNKLIAQYKQMLGID